MKPHETWLVKAKNDLKSSKKLIKGDDVVLEEEDVHEAIQIAEKILNFVKKKIEMSSNEESAEGEVKENEEKEGDEDNGAG